MRKSMITMALCVLAATTSMAKDYTVKSPDRKVVVTVTENDGLSYNVSYEDQKLVKDSPIGLTLNVGGKTVSAKTVKKAKETAHKGSIQAVVYKKNVVEDNYNELALALNDGLSLLVRAYDDGAAYRFVSVQKRDYVVESEKATFNFAEDWVTYMPYTNSSGTIEQQFKCSFENTYTHTELSKLDKDHLSFIPFIVEADNDIKIVVSEADLEDYPGMFVLNKSGKAGVEGVFAPYPKNIEQGGHNKLQLLVKSRENYIANGKKGVKNMPWRVLSIATEDKQLLNDDMVYRLASPNRIGATNWIKPGKVAWEWWNCWGVYNVNFTSGINNDTYKYYIDFASKYGIEYVILDEGWAVNLQADLFQIIPEIDLKGLVDYAKSKNVGIILWAGWYAFERDMERVCKEYSEMGVKGFKVD
ncbi:MAG: glycoside hydrolase family 97 N-terminal domain-containing protein, partial [Bacteroidaceae bacterium]|nr:glycoside hydrolase family 97 N-terminal domain-containing protein [Bacteroidaceae bacterium]